MKDTKLTPRITETAKALWYIYLVLTLACALCYWVAGMSLFDAVCHAFTTVSTAGFSTHDASIAHYDSVLIESIAIFFMVLGGINFALHFLVWRRLNPKVYIDDPEVRTYVGILAGAAVLTTLALYATGTYSTLGESLRYGLFQVATGLTTTGYTTAEFHNWPGMLAPLVLVLALIGACGGSTAGGMKVLRVLLLYRQSLREVVRLMHPNAHIPVRVGGTTLSGRMVDSVWGFFFLYVVSFILLGMCMAITGLDLVTAFAAAGISISNLGPGLGEIGSNFTTINDAAKWLAAFGMVLGRLEIFTVLVLFSPAFWRN